MYYLRFFQFIFIVGMLSIKLVTNQRPQMAVIEPWNFTGIDINKEHDQCHEPQKKNQKFFMSSVVNDPFSW